MRSRHEIVAMLGQLYIEADREYTLQRTKSEGVNWEECDRYEAHARSLLWALCGDSPLVPITIERSGK